MPVIKPNISKGQLVALHFAQDNVAASQTDVQLLVTEVASAAALAIDGYVMPFAGEVVAISWSLSAAGSAGSLTIGVTKDGTENASTTQTVTTAAEGRGRFKRGTMPFVALDQLGVEITTDGTWNGTSSDLEVLVWALVYLEGI